MTSKFKALIDGIQPSSSAGVTEEKARPSLPSAGQHSTGGSTRSTTITPKPSAGISTAENAANKRSLNALMMRAAVLSLEQDGLIRRYRVLSRNADGSAGVVREIRLIFDPSIWTADLLLLDDNTSD